MPQNVPSQLALQETIKLLNDLATHLSPQTKFMEVPPGTMEYILYRKDLIFGPVKVEVVHFCYFFGMVVGYDIPTDILFYWKP